jgi:biotin carboxyl carrier protein
MRISRWLGWLKWPVTLAVFAGLLAGAYNVHTMMKAAREAEGAGDAVKAPRRTKGGIVTLTPELIEKHGIKEESAQAVDWSEPVTVYGRLVPNPRATGVLQAPFAGVLRSDSKQPWPEVGTTVRAGQILGQVDLRIGPQERLDIQLKFNEARLKAQGAEKVVAIQQERFSRLEKASKGGEIVSQRELDDARVLLTDAKTTLATDLAAVKLWKGALAALDMRGEGGVTAYSYPLTAPADGEVVETAARPGMSVEAGAVIARIVNFRRPLAQLDLPPEVLAAGPPGTVELTIVSPSPGRSAAPQRLSATLIGPAPQVEVNTQFSSYWYEAVIGPDPKGIAHVVWRPGRFVSAVVRLPDAPKRLAVSVPAEAVLSHQGRLLVYVREGPGKFERREVRLLGREGDRAVLGSGVKAGEPVVIRHAQVLLSEEFRAEGQDD